MSERLEKVNDQVRDLLMAIIHREYGSQYGLIAITKVKTSPDLRSAKVFISIFPEKPEFIDTLKSDQKKIRRLLAGKIQLKNTPEIKFFIDDTLAQADKIEQLLKEVKK